MKETLATKVEKRIQTFTSRNVSKISTKFSYKLTRHGDFWMLQGLSVQNRKFKI
jgi:hypothetical protein